jgi:hypothetical protein
MTRAVMTGRRMNSSVMFKKSAEEKLPPASSWLSYQGWAGSKLLVAGCWLGGWERGRWRIRGSFVFGGEFFQILRREPGRRGGLGARKAFESTIQGGWAAEELGVE